MRSISALTACALLSGYLGAALAQATEGNKDARIFLRADKTVSYGDLMEIMNLLRTEGFLKIALVGLEKTQ